MIWDKVSDGHTMYMYVVHVHVLATNYKSTIQTCGEHSPEDIRNS